MYSISSAQNGIVKSYYPDGSVQSEISYVNDILDGTAVWYYPNGKLKSEKNFSKGILDGWVKEYFETGLLREEYFVKNGVKDGTNRFFYENGALKSLSNYANGNQMQLQLFDYDSTYNPVVADTGKSIPQQIKPKRSKNNYQCNVDICPEPIGGMKSVQDNLIYPEHALRYGLEGTVTLTARISTNGNVLNTEIIRGMGFGCSEAAQEAVKKTKFLPGENNGIPVESAIALNIEFKIFENKSSPELKQK